MTGEAGFRPGRLFPFGLFILAGLLLPGIILPAETSKLFTEDAAPVDPGTTEVELKYGIGSAGRAYDAGGKLNDRPTLEGQTFTVTVTRGLADGLDIRTAFLWRDVIKDDQGTLADGVGNIVLNVKWRLWESASGRASLSWLPGATAPISDPAQNEQIAPGQVYWSIDNLFAATWIDGHFNISGDAGYFLAIGGERDEQRAAWFSNVGAGYQFMPRVQGELELSYSRVRTDGRDDSIQVAVTGGAVLSLPRAKRLDVGLQHVVDGRLADRATIFVANYSMTFQTAFPRQVSCSEQFVRNNPCGTPATEVRLGTDDARPLRESLPDCVTGRRQEVG